MQLYGQLSGFSQDLCWTFDSRDLCVWTNCKHTSCRYEHHVINPSLKANCKGREWWSDEKFTLLYNQFLTLLYKILPEGEAVNPSVSSHQITRQISALFHTLASRSQWLLATEWINYTLPFILSRSIWFIFLPLKKNLRSFTWSSSPSRESCD